MKATPLSPSPKKYKSEVNRLGTQNLRYEELPDFLTIKELQQWLRIGQKKAYALANTPGFPHLKFGVKKIFPKAEVREWLAREAKFGRLSKKLRQVI
jgi:predicted DNA-binding transcriptional regulator AlpA